MDYFVNETSFTVRGPSISINANVYQAQKTMETIDSQEERNPFRDIDKNLRSETITLEENTDEYETDY